jgi:hypothetical protein
MIWKSGYRFSEKTMLIKRLVETTHLIHGRRRLPARRARQIKS